MKLQTTLVSLLMLAAGHIAPLAAQPRPAAIFTDNMVLQQRSTSAIWGEAAPGRKVTVTPSWDSRHPQETLTDESGYWRVELATPKAGGPYTLTISDGMPVVLKNILIGEVWLCSGQSNMEMRVADRVLGYEEEIAQAGSYPEIRLLHIDNTASPTPLREASVRYGGWQVCSPETIADFSATAYFFGKELQQRLKVPVGLIESCWGGTVAEAWTSPEALSELPAFATKLERLKHLPTSRQERQQLFEEEMTRWNDSLTRIDSGYREGMPLWAKPGYETAEWQQVRVPGYLPETGSRDFRGFIWLRRDIEIPEAWAGSPLTLSLAAIDDNDCTYFNGVEIGHTEGWLTPRRYTIPDSLVKAGKATVAVRVMDTGGNGGIYGESRDVALVKSESERLDLSGEWSAKVSLHLSEAPEMPVNTASEVNYPAFLYNAMIHPLIGHAIRGAIWYQGEANVDRAEEYADLLPIMIRDWRRRWGYDFPFYLVQLANFMAVQQGAEESEWAELREAQLKTLRLQGTGMAVAIDIGEAADIHPKNKPEVGRRLALQALASTYGKKVVCSGPVYEEYTIEDDRIRIRFSHTEQGLTTSDAQYPTGFYIAGADRRFHKAEARIEGNTVVVFSSEVPYPVAVRYGWANNPVVNLRNGVGLPAGPFRTDSWSRIEKH